MSMMVPHALLIGLMALSSLTITHAQNTLPLNAGNASQVAQQQAAQSLGSPWLSSRLLTPHLTVTDVVQSKQFYQAAFGFQVRYEDQPGAHSQHVEMSYRDELVLMFVPERVRGTDTLAPISIGKPTQKTAYFYLYVPNVDLAFKQAIAAGGQAITEPHQSAWGDDFAIVADPSGYHWGLANNPNMVF
ncbi:MAG: VOC family protein [Neisseriaceae bacterium]|nr:VOC family protein [Neisseriaceae bacterium]